MNPSKIAVCSLLLIFSFSLQATESWLRITNPGPQLRDSLPPQGIEYEHFLWVPAEQNAEWSALLTAAQTTTIDRPFHFRIDQQWLDLKTAQLPGDAWFASSLTEEADFHLLQFAGPVRSEWLAAATAEGIELVRPLAPFSWIVWARPQQLNVIEQQSFVRQTAHLLPVFRVQADNRNLNGTALYSMGLVYQERQNAVMTQLEAQGASVLSVLPFNDHLVVLNFRLDGDQYLNAANIPGLLTIQRIDPSAGPRGEMSQQTIVNNYTGQNPATPGWSSWLSATGLDGNGVTVSVVDGGIYQNHPDLTNVIPCSGTGASCNDSSDSHGTHVAGAIGGTGINGTTDGNGFNRGLGVAPGVQIVEQLYSPLLGGGPGGMVAGGMLSIYKDAQTSGALLSNNSWGPTGSPQGYDIPTMEIDMISRDANPDLPGNQPVLAVWSIMNGGGDGFGSCSPSSLGSPDEAKNLFAVGSTSLQSGNLNQVANVFNVSSNSAHGPACDGRQVPHIVAPGCNTDAPDSPSGYGLKCGTSMASPVISGAVSLFWEQYRNNNEGADPSPALVKSVFTAVADDLEGNNDADGQTMGHAPDRKQGWGRVNLEKVINPVNDVYLFDQAHVFDQTGQQWQLQLRPDDPQQPMRLMLVWTDAPGSGLGGTNPAWVNDLDLSVTADQLYLGNQFGADAFSSPGGSPDGINNMEAVFLRADQHNGNPITVSVLAANIVGDALNPYVSGTPQQDFALACYNCREQALPDLIFADDFGPLPGDLIFYNGFNNP
ncbi:S8 family serine peptidase [Marinicella sediminis]|uniref:S8 family serine peptidase n=1 Tax=Marinicella sediminis TaxID=1792834 RepID=A0ABV7J8Q8_9GAMM|nr:S8 family serine peptidase [Marinicella sediminis]